jgi:hypothetical protein
MAIVISPLYPVAGDTVTLSLDNETGTEHGFYLSSSPTQSEIDDGFLSMRMSSGLRIDSGDDDESGLLEFDATRLQSMIDAGVLSAEFTPDASGEYTFVAYETRKVHGVPAYPGDPNGEVVQQLITTQSTTIYVGEYVDLPLVTKTGDGATLRLQVNNDTVRAATLVNHRTTNAEVAAQQTTVTAALTACAGVTVAAVGADLVTAVNDLKTQYEAHAAEGPASIHLVVDTWNTLSTSTATDQQGAILLLNDLRDTLLHHLLDSTQSGHLWHYGPADDLENHPLAAQASTLQEATVLCADLRLRSYDRHRVADGTPPPTVHTPEDTTNTVMAATKLDDVIVAFFDALVSNSNTAQDGENQGEVDLRAFYGFTRIV